MKYHCGLLDEQPYRSRTVKWLRQCGWERLPPDVNHELMVWLSMPGFPVNYHVATLGRAPGTIMKYKPCFDDYRADVSENWLSATREDCVRLAHLRAGPGHIPIICQYQMLADLKGGMSQIQVAREYGSNPRTVWQIAHHGVTPSKGWPAGLPRP